MRAQLSRERSEIIKQTANHILSREDTSEHSENLKAVAELALLALAGMDSVPPSFDELRDAVVEMTGGRPIQWIASTDKGHQVVPFINFNSLARIVDKFRAAPPAPVAVPDEMYWQDAPVEGSARAAAYATGWNACRAAMLKAGPVTAATVPLTRLDLAIFEACKHFLLCSDGSGKKYDGIFYDPETELSFSIYELAEKLGIVKCTGNRCWSLLPQVSDEIDAVYRKYALLMLAAAPAAPEQEV